MKRTKVRSAAALLVLMAASLVVVAVLSAIRPGQAARVLGHNGDASSDDNGRPGAG